MADKIVDEIDLREKTTYPIVVKLLADNVVINLSGVDHCEWHMMDGLGKIYRYSSSATGSGFTISSASGGLVQLIPADETVFQYTRSPYKLYVAVYETASQRYSVPEDGYLKINVCKEY